MLAHVLALTLALAQQTALRARADDPLHRSVTVQAAADGATVEHFAQATGSLSIWASSEALDPRLRVEVLGRDGLLEDDDSGGGTTAWLLVEVEAGEALEIAVAASEPGAVELHVVAAPESDATRAAVARETEELAELVRLLSEGAGEEGRRRAAALVEELLATPGAPTSRRIGEALWRSGAAAYRLSALEAADAAFAGAYASRRRLLPPEHPDLVAATACLALSRRDLGRLTEALALQEAVVAARERLLPAGHPALLGAKQNLAVLLGAAGELARAHALEEEVLAARARLLPADDPDLLTAKLNLAGTRFERGDLVGARALCEEVHAARTRLLPEDDPELLTAKQDLAVLLKADGELAAARALEEQVLAARERRLPAGHPALTSAKLNLAGTRHRLGDREGALALFEEVHAAREGALPAGHPELLVAKQDLAAARKVFGDLAGARELEEAVLAARVESLAEGHPDLLAAKGNLALTLRALGDAQGAMTLQREVLAARQRILPPDHPDLLSAMGNLAATRATLGDLEGARALEERVHAARARALPADHPDLLVAKGNLALTRYGLGDVDGARALTLELARGLASRAERAVLAAPREARATGAEVVRRLAKARVCGGPGDAELAAACFEALETARHAAGSPLAGRAARAAGREAAALRARMRRAEAELDRLVASGPEAPTADVGEHVEPAERRGEAGRAWREAIQAAATRRDGAQRELLGLVTDEVVTRVTAAAVGAALEEDELAVGITKLDGWRWDPERRDRVASGPRYLAQVVRPGGVLREVDLGPAAELEARVRDWRRALGAPLAPDGPTLGAGSDGPDARGVGLGAAGAPDEAELGRALRRALVDPLLAAAGEPEDGTTLRLCLDDALFTVPVDALPLDEQDGEPSSAGGDVPRLGDRFPVRIELSLARLLVPSRPSPAAASLLVVGDLDFDARPRALRPEVAEESEGATVAARWSPLPGAAAEVADLVDRARRELGVEARVLRGGGATQAALAEAVRGRRIVHVATHGFFVPSAERKSLLDEEPEAVAGRGAAPSSLGERGTVTGFAPLTLCGLVLSGANVEATAAEGSAGLLTAQELAGLDLSACDLAVLSACETNVGVARAGQGIQSLQSALHMAGARTSVTSLWSVRDRPTRSLMARFYECMWERGMPKADALWAAKRALRREGSPPHAWAGWMLAGAPD